MPEIFEVVEGLRTQHSGESLVYKIDCSNRGIPTAPSVVSVKNNAGSDVKGTVMPSGSATVSGLVVLLPSLTLLTAEDRYEVKVSMTIGGDTHIGIIDVDCPE